MEASLSATTVETAQKLGLLPEEFDRIEQILGRNPNFTELSIFSVMWSEHCSYKNSITYLKTLPRDGEKLLVGAGEENAGLVDIGNGWACAFKIESHNHPSAIEPYQGAATGVGGIHRDIFTMGARPIAAMNSLRFGNIDIPHTKHLIKGVVKGIGDYGNCLGVPTVGGETYFNDCYNQNILVNAMSIGVVKVGQTVSAIADGPGNPVFIVGSATGKDGIHGATFASADLTEDSAEDLPAVQVGDPFQEKLLLEASLEAIQTGAIVGMQDMGAAGITCSTSEMSAKSETGMIIDLDKVPTRQANMEPFEILLSESQERMLIVVHKGQEDKLLAVFDKWDLECEEIGVVTDTGRLEFFKNGEKCADVPAHDLVLGGGAPVYKRKFKQAKYYKKLKDYGADQVSEPNCYKKATKELFKSPNIASKKWIYEQYDHSIRLNNMNMKDPSDASIIRLKHSDGALVTSVDCNSRFVYADPFVGAQMAISEAARNIVCSGGDPIAITNCLNFGNPYDPEVYWQFVNTIKGMGKACRKFGTPVTGGNVSFYNQTVLENSAEPVYPTPTIGMLGLMKDRDLALTLSFKKKGHTILVLGDNEELLNGSEYLHHNLKLDKSKIPSFDLKKEHRLQRLVKKLNRKSLLKSAHDISDGGLITNIIESAMAGNVGCSIYTKPFQERKDFTLFGETPSRIVITCKKSDLSRIKKLCKKAGISCTKIGFVGGKKVRVDGDNWGKVSKWSRRFTSLLSAKMDNEYE